jgi:hypothetical protein
MAGRPSRRPKQEGCSNATTHRIVQVSITPIRFAWRRFFDFASAQVSLVAGCSSGWVCLIVPVTSLKPLVLKCS